MTPRPIFLLSLPRSGSTLVQRLLAAHPAISTAPEPWILLPQVYALRERGGFADYGHVPAARAIGEFAERLPDGVGAYRSMIRELALGLYEAASDDGAEYFIDKTPRYHLIAGDLFEIFPEAAFVFLWRHPVAVACSIAETWSGGRWNLERWRRDLFDGPGNLVDAFEANSERAIAIRFEDLLTEPDRSLGEIFSYLGLPDAPDVVGSFGSVRLDARMGDPTGVTRYDEVSREPLDRWKASISNPLRKRWSKRYLTRLGPDRLATMGYDLPGLLAELDAIPVGARRLSSDLASSIVATAGRAGRELGARVLWRTVEASRAREPERPPPPEDAGRSACARG